MYSLCCMLSDAVYAFDAEDDEVQSMVTRFRTAPSPSDTGFVVFGA